MSPRAYPDFAWAFGGRVAVNIGNALGTTYLLYFFTNDLKLQDPDTALLEVTAIYLVFTLITTYGGGVLSDRSGRRRMFVAVASVLQGIAAVLLVIWPSFGTTLVAGAFLGAGYGAFLSVDQALVTQVLPDAETRAKDLGIMNIGTNVPQAIAPVVAALVIDQLGGYRVLFAFAGDLHVPRGHERLPDQVDQVNAGGPAARRQPHPRTVSPAAAGLKFSCRA